MENVIFAWNIAKAALGLGFVIFIHELGHFLLAKWNGVKVERFSIGFGPTLASFRKGVGLRVGAGSRAPGPGDPPTWGETEYVLAALPLGGYVKMLGESHDAPPKEEEEVEPSTDPRAFNNKSVWARMQIITAGVIMNVLLGLACFTFVYSQGVTDRAATIGGVLAGSPAFKAGLRGGDEIVAIDGRRDVSYKDLLSRVSLSGAGQKIRFGIKRPGIDAEQAFEIEPLRDSSGITPTIGIVSAQSLDLIAKPPFLPLPGQEVDQARPTLGFEGEDKVVGVGPEGGPIEPVVDQADFARKIERFKDRPAVVEVERKKVGAVGSPDRVKVTVPPHHFLDFGLKLTPGPIVAIRPDSPALKAGLREGDRIVSVDGDPDYDPMKFPDLARNSTDRPMTLAIERVVDGKPVGIEVKVTPDASPAWVEPFDPRGRMVPLEIAGLGLALAIESKVKAVEEGSPASKAGIKAGDSLRSMILIPAKSDDEKSKPKAITIKLDGKVSGWPLAFAAIQDMPTESIELTTDKADKPMKVMPEVDPSRFHPLRGLLFQPLVRKMAPLGLADSLQRGWDETVDNVFGIFRIFRGLFQGRVSGDAFGGLIPISQIAYASASSGWTTFLQFLGMLSINLAVLNFLPIPPLDGGQFVILSAEKVRGKPLPDSALNLAQIAGLVFVLGLMLFVNGKDVFKLVQGSFWP